MSNLFYFTFYNFCNCIKPESAAESSFKAAFFADETLSSFFQCQISILF